MAELTGLDGVLAPICTPFTADGELALEDMRANIEQYNETALAGYVVAGSTGESVFLSRDEKLRLFDVVRASAASQKMLVAGTGTESVRETVDLANAAAGIGYHAALVLTPHYYRGQMARAEAQLAFYRGVADASRIPILIYNFPQMTGLDLGVEVVRELAEHPRIVGIKESSAEMAKIEAMITGVPAGFQVLVGSSVKFHASLKLGAVGGILAIGNALPRAAAAIHERYRSGDVDGSAEAQQKIAAAAGVAPKYGIQGLKYAMDLRGLRGGWCRLPLLGVSEAEKREIEALFAGVEK